MNLETLHLTFALSVAGTLVVLFAALMMEIHKREEKKDGQE